MKNEFIEKTKIDGLFIIRRPTYEDNRGFFREVVRLKDIEDFIGHKFRFRQWSHSLSFPKVIRALHSEDQNKLVYPITGEMFGAYVDLRKNSKTFAKVVTVNFGQKGYQAVFVPKGVANSICVVGNKPVHYMYLIDEYYEKSKTKGVIWNDPDLAIRWPIKNPIVSDRDKQNPTLRSLFPDKFV